MGPTSKGSPLSSRRDQLAEIAVPRNQVIGGSTQTINEPISLRFHIETYSEVVFRQFSISRMYGQGQGRDVMMTNDGSHKYEELGSARFSYLVAHMNFGMPNLHWDGQPSPITTERRFT